MPAGREMDALVAEKVMGLPGMVLGADTRCPITGGEMRMGVSRAWCFDCHEWHHSPYKEYSIDISAAWEVVEKMRANGCGFSTSDYGGFRKGWSVTFYNRHGDAPATYEAETLPIAICRAALKAVEGR